jgi:hypothetical protein
MLKRLYLIVGFIFLALMLPAHAQHRHGHHRHHHHYQWIAPMVIGGAVTYVLTRPQQPQTVFIEQQPGQPIVLQPNQRIVCNNVYQVYSSHRGVYEVREGCWIQQF